MNITKKICMSLCAMIAGLFVVGNVYAADDFYYNIEIDGNESIVVEKKNNAGDILEVKVSENAPWVIDDGAVSFNLETGKLTLKEGVRIGKLKITSNVVIEDSEAFINEIDVNGGIDGADLEVINSKIFYDETIPNTLKQWSADGIFISNSELDLSVTNIQANEDLFIEKSTINATSLIATSSVVKISDSTINARAIFTGNAWGNTWQGMDWLEPDDYEFMGDNGRAYYGVIIDNSDVKLVGESQGYITSDRGILIKDSTVTDESTLNQFIQNSIQAGNSGADDLSHERAITIDNSEVSVKGNITSGSHMSIVMKDSTVIADYSIGTDVGSVRVQGELVPETGGNLTITNSIVSSKSYIDESNEKESRSAIIVDGNLTIENSKVTADASASNGKIAAIAYTGTFTMDDLTALNIEEAELVKDIDISDIAYNRRLVALDENKNIYTLGVKSTDGTTTTTSDFANIGTAVEITITIENGTWEDGTDDPIVIKKIVGDELTEEDLPTGMKSTNGSTKGSWNKTLPLTVSEDLDLTYTFEIENPNTADNVLIYVTLGLVSLISIVTIVTLRKRFQ